MTEITDDFMRGMLTKARVYTAVILKAGPNANHPERPSIVWEHARRNFQLRADGKLAIVCPVMDDSPVRGLGLFTTDQQETTAIMDGDPGVKAGVFVYDVHPVRGFPGDALP